MAVRTGLVPGNHVITQILQTRPDPTALKQGTKGTPVKLVCNYFRVTKTSTWQLYLYRVDFTPEVQIRKLQSGLLHEQLKHHGRYLFDGTMLYMLSKLDKDVTEFVTKGNKDDQTYLIKVKLICVVPSGTYQYFHVWSTLLRKCELMLGMQLLGRNYYDPVQRVRFSSSRRPVFFLNENLRFSTTYPSIISNYGLDSSQRYTSMNVTYWYAPIYATKL